MQSTSRKSIPTIGKAAFTLTEMLVVICIIAILLSVGAVGVGGMAGKGISTGVTTTEALFSEARAAAMGRSIRVCVLVAKSLASNHQDDLRRIVVAYEPVDAVTGMPSTPDGQEPQWEISSRGVVLPDQTFFSEKLSKKDHTSGAGSVDTVSVSNAKTNYQGEYFKYEFNSQGICLSPGASFVIGNGSRVLTMSSSSSPPKVTSSGKRDFGGFIVWRGGNTSIFRTPQQISSDLPSVGSTF